MQDRSQEDTTEQESRTCRSKIVMLHYDESMKSVQTGITRRGSRCGSTDRSKKKRGTKESMITDQFGKKWYKGNLHTHSTNSDGRLSPEEVIGLYREEGYDFLALTDHWFMGEERQEENFLLLSGAEYDVGNNVRDGIYHVVGIGMQKEPKLEKGPELQEKQAQLMIDRIHEAGGIAILAHPAWSMNRASEVRLLKDLDGCEIYNTTSGVPWNCRPYSGIILDELAAQGYVLPCMAADDAHHYTGDETKSYLMVQADELSRDAILEAIAQGRFYASQGPRFWIEKKDNSLIVHSTPVKEIVFFTDAVWSDDRATVGECVEEAVYEIQPHETFVRVELKDAVGNRAWSNFYLTGKAVL